MTGSSLRRRLPLWLTRVQSHSMSPGLRDGQLVWTLRPLRTIRRGAVVVAEPSGAGRRVLKRVVGLPGEQVRLQGGRVWIDGALLPEPYASRSSFRGAFDVPEGHYLLLGDNRDASTDSRSWSQPYVGREEIVGVLIRRGSPAVPPSRRSRPAGRR